MSEVSTHDEFIMNEEINFGLLYRIGRDGKVDKTFQKLLPLRQAVETLTRMNTGKGHYAWKMKTYSIHVDETGPSDANSVDFILRLNDYEAIPNNVRKRMDSEQRMADMRRRAIGLWGSAAITVKPER